MRELRIIESDRGYVLVSEYWETDDRKETDYIPIEDVNGEDDCMKRLLEAVAEHFGYSYNKYGKNNINVTFDKLGHKVE
uniref:Uncharacterized protein n=1 Tax=viral metagenome TaxID=1070528 RepID=A0A6M3LKA8_9ZZZZ